MKELTIERVGLKQVFARYAYLFDRNHRNHQSLTGIEGRMLGCQSIFEFRTAILRAAAWPTRPKAAPVWIEIMGGSTYGAFVTRQEWHLWLDGFTEALGIETAIAAAHRRITGRIDFHLMVVNKSRDGRPLWRPGFKANARRVATKQTRELNEVRLNEGRLTIGNLEERRVVFPQRPKPYLSKPDRAPLAAECDPAGETGNPGEGGMALPAITNPTALDGGRPQAVAPGGGDGEASEASPRETPAGPMPTGGLGETGPSRLTPPGSRSMEAQMPDQCPGERPTEAESPNALPQMEGANAAQSAVGAEARGEGGAGAAADEATDLPMTRTPDRPAAVTSMSQADTSAVDAASATPRSPAPPGVADGDQDREAAKKKKKEEEAERAAALAREAQWTWRLQQVRQAEHDASAAERVAEELDRWIDEAGEVGESAEFLREIVDRDLAQSQDRKVAAKDQEDIDRPGRTDGVGEVAPKLVADGGVKKSDQSAIAKYYSTVLDAFRSGKILEEGEWSEIEKFVNELGRDADVDLKPTWEAYKSHVRDLLREQEMEREEPDR